MKTEDQIGEPIWNEHLHSLWQPLSQPMEFLSGDDLKIGSDPTPELEFLLV